MSATEANSTSCLLQRISVAMQWGNAMAVMSCAMLTTKLCGSLFCFIIVASDPIYLFILLQ